MFEELCLDHLQSPISCSQPKSSFQPDHVVIVCIQGEASDPVKIKHINSAVREGERLNIRVINYKKGGQPFLNHLQITPLRSGPLGEYTHLLGILDEEPLEQYTCQLRQK